MLSEHERTESGTRCRSAAASIMELLKFQCQGFILPPTEVKNLLGLDKDDRTWHLNESIGRLKKELARRFVAMEVNPIQGTALQGPVAVLRALLAEEPQAIEKGARLRAR